MALRPRKFSVPLAGIAGGAFAAAGWYATRVEPFRLRINRLLLPVPDLPPAFEGYRIGHLSDLHMGTRSIERHAQRVVGIMNRERPDLVAITGDFATDGADWLGDDRAILSRLRAPDGIWGVLGNHDYLRGAGAVIGMLDRAGVRLLRNTHGIVERGGDRLVLAGIDDVLWGKPDLPAALADSPERSPVILLAHEPDFARVAAVEPRIVLQLSGHTHGGQVRFPLLGAPVLPQFGHVYPLGAYRVGRMALYVTAGVGTGRAVIRFNCRPEMTIFKLVRGAGSAADRRQYRIFDEVIRNGAHHAPAAL